jgi:predicted transcriptional regulator
MNIICTIFDDRGICVSEIAKKLGLSVAITSYHLKRLAAAGLLEPCQEGRKNCYRPTKVDFIKDLKRLIKKYK